MGEKTNQKFLKFQKNLISKMPSSSLTIPIITALILIALILIFIDSIFQIFNHAKNNILVPTNLIIKTPTPYPNPTLTIQNPQPSKENN